MWLPSIRFPSSIAVRLSVWLTFPATTLWLKPSQQVRKPLTEAKPPITLLALYLLMR